MKAYTNAVLSKKQGYFNYRQSRTRMVVEEAYGQSLRKIPQLHLISWCGNLVFPQNFYTRKLREITSFYAVS